MLESPCTEPEPNLSCRDEGLLWTEISSLGLGGPGLLPALAFFPQQHRGYLVSTIVSLSAVEGSMVWFSDWWCVWLGKWLQSPWRLSHEAELRGDTLGTLGKQGGDHLLSGMVQRVIPRMGYSVSRNTILINLSLTTVSCSGRLWIPPGSPSTLFARQWSLPWSFDPLPSTYSTLWLDQGTRKEVQRLLSRQSFDRVGAAIACDPDAHVTIATSDDEIEKKSITH